MFKFITENYKIESGIAFRPTSCFKFNCWHCHNDEDEQ